MGGKPDHFPWRQRDAFIRELEVGTAGVKASAGTSPFFPPPDSAAAAAGDQEGRLGGCRAAPWDPWDGLGASGRRVAPGPVAHGCRGPWGSGGGGVPRGRWPAPAPSASRPAPRRPGGGGGSFFTFLTSPLPRRFNQTCGGRKSRPLARAGWSGLPPRCGVTGCGRSRASMTSLPPSGLWAGETLALVGGGGMEEGRKCGGRGGTGRGGKALAGRERRANAGCLPLLRSANCGLRAWSSCWGWRIAAAARPWPGGGERESGRKLYPRGWGRRFAARWHRKRDWPFDWGGCKLLEAGGLSEAG